MDVRNIRNAVGTALVNNNGKVDQATVDELVGEAKTDADKQLLADEFSRDAFDSNVDTKALAKSLGVKSLDAPQVSGTLGTDSSGAAIFVSHDFSPKGGFDNAAQATAAAKLSHQPNTAVVEKGGRFYAIETNLPPGNLAARAKDAPALQSTGQVEIGRYADLRDKAFSEGGKDNFANLASYAYGVPKDQINVITDGDIKDNGGKMPTAAPPKINVYIGDKYSSSESGITGPVGDARGANVVNGAPQPASIVIEKGAFDKIDPTRAQKVLFHEGTHLEHNDRLRDLYGQYKNDPKSKGKHAESFETWIDKNKKLDPADKQLMKQLYEDKSTADTEALAHVGSFIEAFTSWAPLNGGDAKAQMNSIGSDLLALPDNPDPKVAAKAQQELLKFYNSMPPETQKQMRALLSSMKSVEGTGWLLNQGPMKDILARG